MTPSSPFPPSPLSQGPAPDREFRAVAGVFNAPAHLGFPIRCGERAFWRLGGFTGRWTLDPEVDSRRVHGVASEAHENVLEACGSSGVLHTSAGP